MVGHTVAVSEVREIKLPGVGVRHEFDAESGDQLAVLVHHDGRREILSYDRDDPDACSSVVTLSHDDSRTLSELLGASQVSEEVAEAQHDVDGQSITWIKIAPGCSAAGRSISEGEYRTKTGASVVAVIREGAPVPLPDPDFTLLDGDLVVAVGPASALDELRQLLEFCA